MTIDVVPLPSMLEPRHLDGRVVVVFDVLRATSTMTAALANGAREVRAFATIDAARHAAGGIDGALLAGERHGVLIDGFDLGNSPHEMARDRVSGRTVCMTTTNGTAAIVAARPARRRFVAAFVNLAATARHVASLDSPVTLLGSGADGEPTGEDTEAAECMAALLRGEDYDRDFAARVERFKATVGGAAVMRRGQGEDLEFAATVDRFDLVCEVDAGDVVRVLSR